MNNIPEIKLGLVAVSRDCFPMSLSRERAERVKDACTALGVRVVLTETVVENERDVSLVLEELGREGCNALVVYLGNFGPEGPNTLLAQHFDGPVMFAAAAEDSGGNLVQNRGDAYCGMLNTSYNIGLRKLRPHIPEYPVGTPGEIAAMIADFIPAARVFSGLKNLKIFSFGPRPQDFLACNAPVKPLYDLGVEIMENSELDLYDIFKKAEGDPRIDEVAGEMAGDLGAGNSYPDLLAKLAQYEVALLDFLDNNLGLSKYGVFASKCWPAFEPYFGFVPCFVNSRLAAKGIPVACEVDIYGALSEYMITCATELPATLLDINNSVPRDMYETAGDVVEGIRHQELFMGFHCGNTAGSYLIGGMMKHQIIMKRLMEPDGDPDITRGTLEGRIKPGEVTIFRLQSTPDARLRAYAAQGRILDMDPRSYGGIGVFAIDNMDRFYRHVLIEKRFPHHTAVGFRPAAKSLFAALRMLGVEEIDYNRPQGMPYPTENPFV